MNLLELQDELGQQIKNITNPNQTKASQQLNISKAIVVSSLAKQIIRIADIVLRSQNYKYTINLSESETKHLIGTVEPIDSLKNTENKKEEINSTIYVNTTNIKNKSKKTMDKNRR